jgi:hypothetical protein
MSYNYNPFSTKYQQTISLLKKSKPFIKIYSIIKSQNTRESLSYVRTKGISMGKRNQDLAIAYCSVIIGSSG